jgi:RNA polymerase sigma factor (sigma-70 family)
MERSDAELLAASRRGERAAFGALIERYQGVVCAVTYSRTGDRALSEDVAQDTFLAAWRQLDQLREVGRLRAWLCGIARHLASKTRRRWSREALVTPVTEPAAETRDADPFERVSERESEQLVREALGKVPEAYREVLVLYYREQRSVREAAEALGISEAAALQRLSRGRQYLADSVTSLVERSLRSALPRKSLVAGVLAALPPLASSHAEAKTSSPSPYGAPMLKIALLAAALTAAGTTAYVTTRSPAAPSTAIAAAPAPQAAPAPPADGSISSRVAAAPPAAPVAAPAAPAAAPAVEVPELPPIDAATAKRLRLHEGPSEGAADAPVTVTVFTDMQCHYCGDALGSLDQLVEDYPGKLRIVVKQMPVHKTAELAAEAALAAEAQGKFWELHDLMLANQEDLSLDPLLALGKRAGLDVAALRDALTKHTYRQAVQSDMETARELELTGTPAFVINGQRVIGHRPIATMRELVNAALARSSS